MNVLNDKNNPNLSRSKSHHRPRPRAAENSFNNNNDPYERSKSPTRSLLSRMPTIMRNVPGNAENNSPRRQKSLVRPERARDTPYRRRQVYDGSDDESKRWSAFSGNGGDDRRKSSMSLARRSSMKEPPRKRKWYKGQCPSCWILFSRIVTFWAPSSLLSCFGMHDRLVQQAWREKIALVFIIFILCIVVGFLTFGLQTVFCQKPALEGILAGHLDINHATILGKVYDLSSFKHNVHPPYVKNEDLASPDNGFSLADFSFLFQTVNFECKDVLIPVNSNNGLVSNYFPCVPTKDTDTPDPNANPDNHGCHKSAYERVDALSQFKVVGEVRFDWNDVYTPDSKYVVYNG
jgi:chitin synthase